MAKKTAKKPTWTPGKYGHAPVNGRYFFVHEESRMTHTWVMGQGPVPPHFKQVTMEEYDLFRSVTASLSRNARKKLLSLYPPKPIAPVKKKRVRKPKE
ncbi:hypothetical protein FCMLKIFP_00102 [Pseudomonas phage Ka3]|uniref:hypothetical protein n=1 Tax=Xanthomonas campestris TaxID=339 RepID=UPI001E7F2157|nr:hypothetical protein [Pseudomonas phage vB_PaeS_TUMS_P6]UNI72001.1 hypothetical protein [Pseudomonas phage vB_PaeP_TUMS_P10]WQZ52452.1 hypothetical protein FCMLKIFP_00102 [Pseudomonas phage Ka3]